MKLVLEAEDDEALNKILEAEHLLREAGIEFDAGMPIDGSPRSIREWMLDYSLTGARLDTGLNASFDRENGVSYIQLEQAEEVITVPGENGVNLDFRKEDGVLVGVEIYNRSAIPKVFFGNFSNKT